MIQGLYACNEGSRVQYLRCDLICASVGNSNRRSPGEREVLVPYQYLSHACTRCISINCLSHQLCCQHSLHYNSRRAMQSEGSTAKALGVIQDLAGLAASKFHVHPGLSVHHQSYTPTHKSKEAVVQLKPLSELYPRCQSRRWAVYCRPCSNFLLTKSAFQ